MSRGIFIFGNGPSLAGQRELVQRVPEQFHTFLCTRAVQWEGLTWTPTYYACSANAILKGVEPNNPPSMINPFLVSRMRSQLESFDDSWHKVYKKEWFTPLMLGAMEMNVKGGGTMPGIMAQLAVWMGYQDIYFLGIEQRGSGHVFDPEGNGKYKYFIPDEEVLFKTWQTLVDTYRPLGIKMTDCTPNGRLNDIIGYKPLEEVLGLAARV